MDSKQLSIKTMKLILSIEDRLTRIEAGQARIAVSMGLDASPPNENGHVAQSPTQAPVATASAPQPVKEKIHGRT